MLSLVNLIGIGIQSSYQIRSLRKTDQHLKWAHTVQWIILSLLQASLRFPPYKDLLPLFSALSVAVVEGMTGSELTEKNMHSFRLLNLLSNPNTFIPFKKKNRKRKKKNKNKTSLGGASPFVFPMRTQRSKVEALCSCLSGSSFPFIW